MKQVFEFNVFFNQSLTNCADQADTFVSILKNLVLPPFSSISFFHIMKKNSLLVPAP